jgi:hypothetical protein
MRHIPLLHIKREPGEKQTGASGSARCVAAESIAPGKSVLARRNGVPSIHRAIAKSEILV